MALIWTLAVLVWQEGSPGGGVVVEEYVHVHPEHRLADCSGGSEAARVVLEMAAAPIFRSDDWRFRWNDAAHSVHLHVVQWEGEEIQDRVVLVDESGQAEVDLVGMRATHVVMVGAGLWLRWSEGGSEERAREGARVAGIYQPPYTLALRVAEPDNGGGEHEMEGWPHGGALVARRGMLRTNWFACFERESVLTVVPEPRGVVIPGVVLEWNGSENVPRYEWRSREQVVMGVVHEDHGLRTYGVRVGGVRGVQALVSPAVLRVESGELEPPREMTVGVHVDHARPQDRYEYVGEVWPPDGRPEGREVVRHVFEAGQGRSWRFRVVKQGALEERVRQYLVSRVRWVGSEEEER